jgi:gluconolactonase
MVWDGQGVLFTDIPNSRIMRYVPATETCVEYLQGANRGNGLAIGPDRDVFCCEMGGSVISRWDEAGSRTVVADNYEGNRLNSPNDLVFDEQDRLWFTDPDYDDQDDLEFEHFYVYHIDLTDGGSEITRVVSDTTNPNGLVVSPNGDRLYVAQSEYGEGNARELRAYSLGEDGIAGDYEVLHTFNPHRGIDGMCLDEEGNIVATAGWMESGPRPMIYVFSPRGRVVETHPYPGEAPTNCTFGGTDYQTLYVTGFDGFLYRVETNRTGYLVPP